MPVGELISNVAVPGVVECARLSCASLRRGEPRGGTGGGTRAFKLLPAAAPLADDVDARCLTGGGTLPEWELWPAALE